MTLQQRIEAVSATHLRLTGKAPQAMYQAPGRVNLLGEHTDYSGGFCMPAALSFNTLIAASPRIDKVLRLHSLDFDETVEQDLASLFPPGNGEWHSYCFGTAWSLAGTGVVLKGADLTLQGNVPLGAGLSSSASVEVATATALLGIAGIHVSKAQVALACQKAENVYVGAPCGIMDQFISSAGVHGNALAIDTRSLDFSLAPIPEDLRLVVCNSMVRHSVGGGEYGERRRQVEEAAAVIGRHKPEVRQLRDATLADLEHYRDEMSHEAFTRGRHVITDSQRVLDGVAALRAHHAAEFGRLMSAAHVSYRDDFEASCLECDLLVEFAMQQPGCLGSRLTGGGFGGCTVSLVEATVAHSFKAAVDRLYRDATNVQAQIFICDIADGAGEIAF